MKKLINAVFKAVLVPAALGMICLRCAPSPGGIQQETGAGVVAEKSRLDELKQMWNHYSISGQYQALIDETRPEFYEFVRNGDTMAAMYSGVSIAQAWMMLENGDSVERYLDMIRPFERKNDDAMLGIFLNNVGTKATDIIFSQPVKTQPREVSDVTINIVCDKYFNGDELAELYPEYSGAKGQAAIPVRAETTGDVAGYYYMVYVGDISDPEKDSDDAVIYALTNGGLTSGTTVFYGDFGGTYTVVGVAKGSDGKYGNVYRKAITFDKAGCSPIEEFETEVTNAPRLKASIKKPAFTVPESLQPVCLEKFI